MGFISSEGISRSERNQWILKGARNNIANKYEFDFVEECLEDSCDSLETLSSFETGDDTSSSMSSHDGPLYELSELMANLPIKRGLSKFYQGKSESFGSLTNLKSFEDLAKKSHRSRRSTKSLSRSGQSQTLNPKSQIVKNKRIPSTFIVRNSLFCSFEATSMGDL